ncbi:MAG: hypothetical protein O3A46_05500 [Candidatus Poribacteria bacterium]|nr:hypothetical protein [Candidatus Poribacteria bacterium]
MKQHAIALVALILAVPAFGGVWTSSFDLEELSDVWQGDRENFVIEGGSLRGISAFPIMIFFKQITTPGDWSEYTVECRMNVVEPNMLECSKTALVLRARDGAGIAVALHVPPKQVEVFTLPDREILFTAPVEIDWDTWYRLRVESEPERLTVYLDDVLVGEVAVDPVGGGFGFGVEETPRGLFDDFRIEGPGIPDSATAIDLRDALAVTWAGLEHAGTSTK